MRNKKEKHKIVAVGGGHGLGRVLSALSDFDGDITGIVTTTDNGGSTGKIRASQGGIAWGDTRNCINQLITKPSIGSMIFEYRFKGNGELDGHNLGNLILTALDSLSLRPLETINLIRNMLKISVYIVPMSEHPADLSAQILDGQIISGETNVDDLIELPARLILEPIVPATKEAVQAIQEAELILLGPGSFLTSVMPPLLLPEINKALKNTAAKIVFVRNLGKELGPAGQMPLNTILSWCEHSIGGRRINIVLGSNNDDSLAGNYKQVAKDLASDHYQWYHDKNKLSLAIKQMLLSD
ncbi:uridine diphosphate-N-acetylglucosamine-binding protein YvcK [Candidatus Enterovibrio escicola]|uniref:uridine diphosphate-N-acetylglucosamine-binding protein YvcK n=1 Tax=Candidatus Enterovibrio escicola TaxID=1927127 RepID=UPI001237B390|nr:uridine diphosphate-N-acetylglucosamine-binding protein YvcK [Candidatus Enterovibrio escacola]